MIDLGTISIDRTSLSLSALDLTEANGYIIDRDNFALPAETMDRGLISAPDYDGDRQVRVRKTNGSLGLQVRVSADDGSTLDTRVTALKAAVQQPLFDLTVPINGVSRVYAAYAADCQDGGEMMLDSVDDNVWQVVLTVPVQPNPTVV